MNTTIFRRANLVAIMLIAGGAAFAADRVAEPAAKSAPKPAAVAVTSAAVLTAEKAFLAWEKGENTGSYTDFTAMISPQFDLFSHPVQPARGVYRGISAREMMAKLVDTRSQKPNQLKFSNVRQHQAKNSVVFMFDSEGKVSGYPYKGWNVIALTVGEDNKITGFREYLGDIDPAWFQAR
jgi:hypothetical protein